MIVLGNQVSSESKSKIAGLKHCCDFGFIIIFLIYCRSYYAKPRKTTLKATLLVKMEEAIVNIMVLWQLKFVMTLESIGKR